jgi:hypothetical protein
MSGLLRFLRGNTIAMLALFIALGGTTYAATALPKNSVGTKQLKKNAVTAVKIKSGSVTNGKLGKNAVTGAKVLDNSLTGGDVLESSLAQVPSAASASSATTATTATNALSLGGVAAAGYTKNDCASTTGQIKGYARVLASATFSATFTTTGVTGYSCSGGTIEAMRVATGHYRVRFNGTTLSQGVATSQDPDTGFNFDFVVMGQVAGTPPEFDLWVVHHDGTAEDQAFNVVAYA